MKQFVLVKQFVSGSDIGNLVDGDIAFVKKGSTTAENASSIAQNLASGELNIVVKEKDVLNFLPLHTNKLQYNISSPAVATTYSATIKMNEGTYNKGTYSIIIAKKGVPFNERNKWTVSTYLNVNSVGNYADTIAAELVKSINALQFVKAEYNSGTITITGVEKGVDYTVLCTDGFDLVKPTIAETSAKKAQNDVAAIVDLYNKCAADRGINYTYKDTEIYPSMPFNPLKGADSEDPGFYVINIRFAEPRVVKTTDEVVNQMIHIVSSKKDVITSIESILAKLGTDTHPNVEVTTVDETESPAVE